MATLTNYKGLQVLDAAAGAGGAAINNALKALADRIGPCNYAAIVAPTVNADADPAGYEVGSRWIDTATGDEYVCVDNTNGAAVWRKTTARAAADIGDFATAVGSVTAVANGATAYSWGNHASAGYLTSQTSHADVVVDGDFTSQGIMLRGASSGTYSILADNSANWNTAYGWGNHASAGYLTSQTSHADVVQDGDFTSQGIMLRGATAGTYSILADNSANWNTAYGWGNHASAGYLTSQTSHADVLVDGDFASQGIMLRGANAGEYSILTNNSSNWDSAYSSKHTQNTDTGTSAATWTGNNITAGTTSAAKKAKVFATDGTDTTGVQVVDVAAGIGTWQNATSIEGITVDANGNRSGYIGLFLNYYSSGDLYLCFGGGSVIIDSGSTGIITRPDRSGTGASYDLTAKAGGRASGTNKNGGAMNVSGGSSSGTGTSVVNFQTASAGTSGTGINSPTTKWSVLGDGTLSAAGAFAIYTSGSITGGTFYTGNIEPTADNTYYLGKNSVSTPKAYKGVILKDSANGNYYRLEVTNGALVVTQIT